MDGGTVSADPADWDEEQRQKAALYGTCIDCRAPRDVVTAEYAPGTLEMRLQCLNGHRVLV